MNDQETPVTPNPKSKIQNPKSLDPITLEVLSATLAGIVQEMQNSLFRTGYSTVIRETQDASCALMDRQGRVVAQHIVLGLHMGAFPACVAGLLKAHPAESMAEGDAFLVNHPYMGGSPHAPDMAVITPICYRGELVGFAGSMAHKSDIGGPVPGSCSGQARETYNEGLHLPPVRYHARGVPSRDIEAIIGANSRTPDLVLGDIRGQVGAARVGERRLQEVMDKFGRETVVASFEQLYDLTEGRLRTAIARWGDGEAEAERFIDDDGVDLGKPVRIHVRVQKKGDRVHFDFSGSADQTRGPANVRPPLVQAACAFVLVTLSDNTLPINSGLMRCIDFTTREGSVVNPRFPAPVNTYNPTMHALAEALFSALGQLVPDRRVADGAGTRSIFLGGRATSAGKSYVQYELFGGGSGGRSGRDGVNGTMVNHSNGKIAPLEIIESEFPTRILRFELIPDSGGAGEFRGGLGFVREYEILESDARFSLRSTKHRIPPRGIQDGKDGRGGRCTVHPGTPKEEQLPTRYADYPLPVGAHFRLESPGGGGYGSPLSREPQRVLDDVLDGYVSPEAAAEEYGVILRAEGQTLLVDQAATAEARRNRSSTIA
jgi:N-methylhydantoinase B